MIKRIPHEIDDTFSTSVVAGDFIFLSHHGGGFDKQDIVHQVKATIENMANSLTAVGATLDDVVQLNFYIKNVSDFRKGADVFREYFKNGAPARMTVVTKFIFKACLCQMDTVAYKPNPTK